MTYLYVPIMCFDVVNSQSSPRIYEAYIYNLHSMHCDIFVAIGEKTLHYVIYFISRITLVFYCKCCNLIGYSTRYLFLDR